VVQIAVANQISIITCSRSATTHSLWTHRSKDKKYQKGKRVTPNDMITSICMQMNVWRVTRAAHLIPAAIEI
jgi:hypothetical protein